ncbi:hypothetical protein Hanom_Chr02g00168101 [Helianthus anomalus]
MEVADDGCGHRRHVGRQRRLWRSFDSCTGLGMMWVKSRFKFRFCGSMFGSTRFDSVNRFNSVNRWVLVNGWPIEMFGTSFGSVNMFRFSFSVVQVDSVNSVDSVNLFNTSMSVLAIV